VKKIITHINPDTDAIAATWLIKRFLPGWKEAEISFTQAAADAKKIPGVDDNPEIYYVDVGRGKFDHHQKGEINCAAKIIWEYIQKQTHGVGFRENEKQAIQELVEIENEIDNFGDLKWPEIKQTRYFFYFHLIVDGLRGCGESNEQIMEYGFRTLDSILLNLKAKIKAEAELKKGIIFATPWGKGIAVVAGNKQVLLRGEVLGYAVVVKKDPRSGGVRIYCRWDNHIDLTKACQEYRKLDPQSDWFLHASKKLLLNQSSLNLNMRPTKLSLEQIIAVLKKPACRQAGS
jgi:hypothetical protein